MQKVPVSAPRISSSKNQVGVDMNDFYLEPWRPAANHSRPQQSVSYIQMLSCLVFNC